MDIVFATTIMFTEDDQTVMVFVDWSVYATDLAAENIKEKAKLWSDETCSDPMTPSMLLSVSSTRLFL